MSRSAIPLAALVLLAASVAGCAGNADPSTSTTDVPTDIQDVEVSKDTGAIRGIVVTPSITPIPDATIRLSSTNQTTKTSESGSFSFSNLKPGTYFLTASKLGFSTTQTSTTVTAGDENPPVVKIQLTEDADTRPYAEMLSWKGFLTCSVAVGGTAPVLGNAGLGGNLCPEEVGEDFIHDFPFGAGIPTYSQSELNWEGTQPLGNYLQLGYYLSGTTDWKAVGGSAPVILNTTHDEIVENKGNVSELTERVFPAYPFQVGQPAGAIVITNQDFVVYTTHFYNFRPAAGWTFIADGECLRPEQCNGVPA